jgi:hypothetical protein
MRSADRWIKTLANVAFTDEHVSELRRALEKQGLCRTKIDTYAKSYAFKLNPTVAVGYENILAQAHAHAALETKLKRHDIIHYCGFRWSRSVADRISSRTECAPASEIIENKSKNKLEASLQIGWVPLYYIIMSRYTMVTLMPLHKFIMDWYWLIIIIVQGLGLLTRSETINLSC